VNAVKWLSDTKLVSVSDDGSIAIYTYEGNPKMHSSWRVHQKIEKAHSITINYLSVLNVSSDEIYFASMCMGGTLKLWASKNDTFELIGEILFGKNLQEAL